MNISSSLIAHREPAVLTQPRQCPLHHPSVLAQLLRALHTLARNPHLDASSAKCLPAPRNVVSLVRVQLLRTLAGSAFRSLDRLDAIQELLKHHRVVPVGSRDDNIERDAIAVDHNVTLRTRFSPIRRIRAGLRTPFFAGTVALSRLARSQSISSASPSRSLSFWYKLSHTPASCQSRSLRQHVIPEPQPISCGSISHGMPLLSTKMMPVSAALSSVRGLPPFGFGGSGGSSGRIASHSSSLTSGLFIPTILPSTLPSTPGFVRHS